MSLSIVPASHPVPVTAAPATRHAAAAPNAEQQTQLNQLVNKYKTTVSRNGDAAAVELLRRQITVAARALGQTVRLPTVLTAANSAPPPHAGGGIGSRVDATA